MRKNVLKPLFFSSLAALGLIAVTGIGGHVIAKRQTVEADAIAQKTFQTYPNTTTNGTAQKLSTLASDLGISSITGTKSDSITPDSDSGAALQAIEQPIRDYLSSQRQKTQGNLDPLPENLKTYLEQHQDTLTAIQSHLSTNPLPAWDLDVEQLADFTFGVPSFIGLVQLQQLLLLKAINDYQQSRPKEMKAALETNLVLQKALLQRPELISYLVSLIDTNNTVGIVRHLAGIDPNLSSQILAIDQQQIGQKRLMFEGWIMYESMKKVIQAPSNTAEDLAAEGFFLQGLAVAKNIPLHHTYLTLSNINIANISDQAYRQLPEFTVCSASIDDIDQQIGLKAPWWNMMGQVSLPGFTRQWQKGGETMLAVELTHHITTAKALADKQGQWPETLPNLESQTCPGEQWIYEVSPEGEMSLSFSHDLDWLEAEENSTWALPLTYQKLYEKSE